MARAIVIGVGNPDRGDDAVGLLVARRVRERAGEGIVTVEHTGDGAALLEAWKGAKSATIVDAARSSAAPGTLHRFDARSGPIPARLLGGTSTHDLGVAEAVELSRSLDQLPARLVVWGIVGRRFDLGAQLSPEVERAAEWLAEAILREATAIRP